MIKQTATNLLHRSFGKDGHRLLQRHYGLLIILPGLGALGFLLWRYTSLQPYIAAAGSGVAAFCGAVPGLVSRKMRGRLITLAFSAAVVALVTAYTTVSLQHQVDAANRRVRAESTRADELNRELLAYIGVVTDDEKKRILLKASHFASSRFSEAVHAPYEPDDFEPAQDVSHFMLSLDRDNGHALYWLGEIARALRDFDQEHSDFNAYLEEERRRSDAREGGTGIAACDRPDGFCLQRTAWIHQLLANDFYHDGMSTKNSQSAADAFQNAIDQGCQALSLYPPNPEKPFPGFSGKEQGIATADLVDRARTRLHKLRVEARPCPK